MVVRGRTAITEQRQIRLHMRSGVAVTGGTADERRPACPALRPAEPKLACKKHKAGRPSPNLLNPILLSLTAVTRASIQLGQSKSGQL